MPRRHGQDPRPPYRPVAARAESAGAEKLAAGIKEAQDPETGPPSAWPVSWGEGVPSEGAADHPAHGMGGMMAAEDVDGLGKAPGEAFGTAFTQMRTGHHKGAVEMAKREKADGAPSAPGRRQVPPSPPGRPGPPGRTASSARADPPALKAVRVGLRVRPCRVPFLSSLSSSSRNTPGGYMVSDVDLAETDHSGRTRG
ncbi:DUF305 domain-containing protein [Streptomyces nitrosporeus]|uniref:DUF305 domain-containing protein n=1 Tax=Streptomyces nitrosporeus TaxID=28894 RepID=UPI003325253C